MAHDLICPVCGAQASVGACPRCKLNLTDPAAEQRARLLATAEAPYDVLVAYSGGEAIAARVAGAIGTSRKLHLAPIGEALDLIPEARATVLIPAEAEELWPWVEACTAHGRAIVLLDTEGAYDGGEPPYGLACVPAFPRLAPGLEALPLALSRAVAAADAALRAPVQEGLSLAPIYENARTLYERGKYMYEGTEEGEAHLKTAYALFDSLGKTGQSEAPLAALAAAICRHCGEGTEREAVADAPAVADAVRACVNAGGTLAAEACVLLYEYESRVVAREGNNPADWLSHPKAKSPRAAFFRSRLRETPGAASVLEGAYKKGFHLAFYDYGRMYRVGYHREQTAGHKRAEDPKKAELALMGGAVLGDPRCVQGLAELELARRGFTVVERTLHSVSAPLAAERELSLPEGIHRIASGALAGITCKTLTLPESLTEIADDAFGDHTPDCRIIASSVAGQQFAQRVALARRKARHARLAASLPLIGRISFYTVIVAAAIAFGVFLALASAKYDLALAWPVRTLFLVLCIGTVLLSFWSRRPWPRVILGAAALLFAFLGGALPLALEIILGAAIALACLRLLFNLVAERTKSPHRALLITTPVTLISAGVFLADYAGFSLPGPSFCIYYGVAAVLGALLLVLPKGNASEGEKRARPLGAVICSLGALGFAFGGYFAAGWDIIPTVLLAAPAVIAAIVALSASSDEEYIHPTLATIVAVVSAFYLSGQSFISINPWWAVFAGILGAAAIGLGFWFASDVEEEAAAVSWCVLPFIAVFFFGGSMAWWLVLLLLAAPAVITAIVTLCTSYNEEFIAPAVATIVTVVSAVYLSGQSFISIEPWVAIVSAIFGVAALVVSYWLAEVCVGAPISFSTGVLPCIAALFFGGSLVWWGWLILLVVFAASVTLGIIFAANE